MSGPVPLTYNGFIQTITQLAVIDVSMVSGVLTGDANFQAILPALFSYSEQRIARDLDLISTQISNNYTTVANSNLLSIPLADFVTVQTLSINGVPLLATSREFLMNVYGTSASAGVPMYFAPQGGDALTSGNTSFIYVLGPWANSTYPVSVVGTIRAPSLYLNATAPLAATATTFISSQLPELLVQASMVFLSQYQHLFGPTSSDPELAGSYEAQYSSLLGRAIVEESRKKFMASAWSSMSPAVVATPGR